MCVLLSSPSALLIHFSDIYFVLLAAGDVLEEMKYQRVTLDKAHKDVCS